MDGTFVIPLDQIFHVLFTATKRKGDTDEVDERRPLNKMPAGNVIEATTKAGENVKICYWPDHFVKFKENQSKMRANRKKKNEEAKVNYIFIKK